MSKDMKGGKHAASRICDGRDRPEDAEPVITTYDPRLVRQVMRLLAKELTNKAKEAASKQA